MKKYCKFIEDAAIILDRVLCIPGILLAVVVVAILADLPLYVVRKMKLFLRLVFFSNRVKE